jgi:hypothetical protein
MLIDKLQLKSKRNFTVAQIKLFPNFKKFKIFLTSTFDFLFDKPHTFNPFSTKSLQIAAPIELLAPVITKNQF